MVGTAQRFAIFFAAFTSHSLYILCVGPTKRIPAFSTNSANEKFSDKNRSQGAISLPPMTLLLFTISDAAKNSTHIKYHQLLLHTNESESSSVYITATK